MTPNSVTLWELFVTGKFHKFMSPAIEKKGDIQSHTIPLIITRTNLVQGIKEIVNLYKELDSTKKADYRNNSKYWDR